MYPSQLDFSNLDLLYVKEELTYSYCDAVTDEVVDEDYFYDDVPASEYINLQCYCDLGSVPNTYGTSEVSFSLSEKAITCYQSWNLTYQWSTANFDGSDETIVDGQTSTTFSQSITNADPFQLILSMYAKLGDDTDLLIG